MPGYPGEKFGEDPFGLANWARKAIYESVPTLHRVIDETENANLLKRFLAPFQAELESVRAGIYDLSDQRDPLKVRGGVGGVDILIGSTVPMGTRTGVETTTDHGFHNGQVVDFSGCSSFGLSGRHKVTVATATTFTIDIVTTVPVVPAVPPLPHVQSVRPVEDGSCTVTVVAVEMVSDADYGDMAQFTVEAGTDLSALGVGWKVEKLWVGPAPDNRRHVSTHAVSRIRMRNSESSVGDLNYIQCAANSFPNVGVGELGYLDFESIPLPYNLRFHRPGLLLGLTEDFGITFDDNDPEFHQRSTVQNVVKYLEKKGSLKGYQIRGETMGFDIKAEGMFALCEDWSHIPSWSKITIPGSSTVYTTIAPLFARFDEIRADYEFEDPGTGAILPLMDSLMYTDGSADGMSPSFAWSKCTQVVAIESETTLPSGHTILVSLGFSEGRVVIIDWGASDRTVYGDLATGSFSFSLIVGGPVAWIDNESYDPGTNRSTIVVGIPDGAPAIGLGEACVSYSPEVPRSDCCWCRTHYVSIIATPTAELIEGYDGDGKKIDDALTRLLPRLVAEQVPIHCEVAKLALGVSINVTMPDAVVVMEAPKESFVIFAPFKAYYDDVPADDVPPDTVGPSVTITVTEIP